MLTLPVCPEIEDVKEAVLPRIALQNVSQFAGRLPPLFYPLRLNTSALQQQSEHLFSLKKLCGNFEGRPAVRLVIGVDLAHRFGNFVECLKRKQPAPAAIVVPGEARLLCDDRPSTREIACTSVTEPTCTELDLLLQ